MRIVFNAGIVACGLALVGSAVCASAAPPEEDPSRKFFKQNQTEYENTVRDLLSIDVDLAGVLPVDLAPGGCSWDSSRDVTQPGQLDDFSLASRLSYLLWSSMPDDELLQLAERGKLRQPVVLREQVERMFDDSKSRSFTENFAGQWLGLREIDATLPDRQLYPEYDELLRSSMIEEVYHLRPAGILSGPITQPR
jgi:hypothetical protein